MSMRKYSVFYGEDDDIKQRLCWDLDEAEIFADSLRVCGEYYVYIRELVDGEWV